MLDKLEKWVFYIFIFLIPVQTRLVLKTWTEDFNEWSSAFLWGTDILIGLLLALWLIRAIKNKSKPTLDRVDWVLVIFVVIAGISITNAVIPQVALFRWIKLLEFVGLYFYVKHTYGNVFTLDRLLQVVIASSVVQALIGIVQSLTQGNLGLRLLGESDIVVGNSGVAVFEVGEKLDLFLRAYGTLPHPNVLAAWLLLGLWSFYLLYIRENKMQWYWWVSYVVMLYGFLLTFSRVTLGLWALGALVFFVYKKMWRPLVLTFVLGLIFVGVYWPQVHARITVSSSEEAVRHRVLFAELAGEVTKDEPVLGLGIGQFVPHLMLAAQDDLEDEAKFYPIAYLYQPVHNVYLLVSSELGVIGLVVFVIFIILSLLRYRNKMNIPENVGLVIIVMSFLVIGVFDHLFWSLQQGGIMFWALLGILNRP